MLESRPRCSFVNAFYYSKTHGHWQLSDVENKKQAVNFMQKKILSPQCSLYPRECAHCGSFHYCSWNALCPHLRISHSVSILYVQASCNGHCVGKINRTTGKYSVRCGALQAAGFWKWTECTCRVWRNSCICMRLWWYLSKILINTLFRLSSAILLLKL